jgi:hypothetical protein
VRRGRSSGDKVTVAAGQGLALVEPVLHDLAALPAHGFVRLREFDFFRTRYLPDAPEVPLSPLTPRISLMMEETTTASASSSLVVVYTFSV